MIDVDKLKIAIGEGFGFKPQVFAIVAISDQGMISSAFGGERLAVLGLLPFLERNVIKDMSTPKEVL